MLNAFVCRRIQELQASKNGPVVWPTPYIISWLIIKSIYQSRPSCVCSCFHRPNAFRSRPAMQSPN